MERSQVCVFASIRSQLHPALGPFLISCRHQNFMSQTELSRNYVTLLPFFIQLTKNIDSYRKQVKLKPFQLCLLIDIHHVNSYYHNAQTCDLSPDLARVHTALSVFTVASWYVLGRD